MARFAIRIIIKKFDATDMLRQASLELLLTVWNPILTRERRMPQLPCNMLSSALLLKALPLGLCPPVYPMRT